MMWPGLIVVILIETGVAFIAYKSGKELKEDIKKGR